MNEADRRRSMLAVIPLAVIAVGLVVPPIVSTRPGVTAISPWQDGPQMFWWVHVAAAVLAVLGGLAVWRRIEPGRASVAIACLAIAGCAYLPARLLQLGGSEAPALSALFAAELVAGVALAVLAGRATGWKRWLRLLGVYAVVTVGYGCPIVPGMVDAFSGGLTFLAALATLLALVTRSFV